MRKKEKSRLSLRYQTFLVINTPRILVLITDSAEKKTPVTRGEREMEGIETKSANYSTA